MVDCERILLQMRNNLLPEMFIKYTSKNLNLPPYVASRYRDKLVEDPEGIIQNISRLFTLSSNIVGLSPDELLLQLNFKVNDQDETRLGALFAELRSVNFLHEEGFSDIKIIKANRRGKSADFSATYHCLKFAIETTNFSYQSEKKDIDEFVKYLVNKLTDEDKLTQLKNTCSRELCDHMMMICVDDQMYHRVFEDRDFFMEAASRTWRKVRESDYLHIAIITGYSSDNMIYPSISLKSD